MPTNTDQDASETSASRIPVPARRTQHVVEGLAVARRRPDSPVGTVVLIHGAMDRADSFGRTMRRLGELDTVAYDRRGYGASAARGSASALEDHVEDLAVVCDWAAPRARPLIVIGHSLGGLIALHAAARQNPQELAAVGAFEAPMPWIDATDLSRPGNAALEVGRRDGAPAAAELFYRAMVGDAVWARLSDSLRADRLAEGPALMADLESSRRPAAEPDLGTAKAPVAIAMGARSPADLRRVAELWAQLLGVGAHEISGSGHGAHLSHPEGFANWIRSLAAQVER